MAVENEIEDLREELQAYKSEEIYNIGTLATEQTPGGKHDKARISTNLAVNATGTDRVPPWFIDKAATPRCLGRSGVNARNRRMVWLSNQKAWMTGRIFKEYLTWFNGCMAERKVMLLIDGFSAHQAGKLCVIFFNDFIDL